MPGETKKGEMNCCRMSAVRIKGDASPGYAGP